VISGYVEVGSRCDSGEIRILTQEDGEVYLAFTDDQGAFSATFQYQAFGTQHFYLLHSAVVDIDALSPSSVLAVTVACGVPVIQSPSADQDDAAADVTIETRRPIISGVSDCPFVTVNIPGQGAITVAVTEGGWSVQPRALANGRYAVSAIATSDGQGTAARESEAVNILVDSIEPIATVSQFHSHYLPS
jgi:hypothetical protein